MKTSIPHHATQHVFDFDAFNEQPVEEVVLQVKPIPLQDRQPRRDFPVSRQIYIWYVYILAYPDGRIFYVGKGKGNRICKHVKEAMKGVKSHKCNTIRKILREGGEVIEQKLAYFANEEEAYRFEQYLIASIGRKNLTNATDGGEGTRGRNYRPSPEHRARISAAHKGRILSPEHRARIAKSNTGKRLSEEARRKISLAHKGTKLSAEIMAEREAVRRAKREAILAARAAKIKPHTEPKVPNLSTRFQSGRTMSLEHRIAVSKAQKDKPKSAEHRAKIGAAHKGRPRTAKQIETTIARSVKTYPGFVSPTGEVFRDVTNLAAFSRQHGLNQSDMVKVANGKKKHCKGWTKYQP